MTEEKEKCPEECFDCDCFTDDIMDLCSGKIYIPDPSNRPLWCPKLK